jgi:hypothetical protein
MNGWALASIVASIVSVVLGGFAIWLALFLYNQSKDTERRVAEMLAAIKAQTDTLQKLGSKMIDRLTTAVTAPRAADEAVVMLISTIREIPTAIAANLRTPAADASQQVWLNEVLTAYIGMYYYAAVVNVAWQGYLPAFEDLPDDDLAKRLVDLSHSDFNLLEGLIGHFDPRMVEANRLQHLHAEAIEYWKPYLKDALSVYRDRQGGSK